MAIQLTSGLVTIRRDARFSVFSPTRDTDFVILAALVLVKRCLPAVLVAPPNSYGWPASLYVFTSRVCICMRDVSDPLLVRV